jgi:pimeloyl-ACP methyl ester carboxylesterase
MPFVDSEGVRIHYEVEGEGPPLLIQHGFGSSHLGWHITG